METKLTIVYLIPSAEISGGTYVACEHAARLAKRGHRVSIAVAQRGRERRIGWFPGLEVPVIGVDDIGPDTDVVVATWWETAYLAARIPSRARCYLVQALEPLFYGESQKAERFFAALTYRLGYPMITVAPWLAKRLEAETGREVCVVRNRLNPGLFGPTKPMPHEDLAAASRSAFLSFGVRSALPVVGQVFWDEGNGFSEAESAGFRMGPEDGERHIPLPDLRRVRRLRIDTGNIPGNMVELSSLRLTGRGGVEDITDVRLWEANPHVAKFIREDSILRMETAGNDPFIIFCVAGRIDARLAPPHESRGFRILVEGPLGIEFKGVRRALEIARRTGAEVWFVEGKEERSVFEGARPDRVFNRVPLDRMREVYSSCDVLLKLSRIESFAYPPLEMMACGGIPVVGDVEGVHEYLVDGYNGVIVPPGDDEATLRALGRLMEDEGLRARIRAGCRETVARLSGWDPSIDILERFLIEKAAGGADAPDETPVRTKELVDCYLDLMKRRDPSTPVECPHTAPPPRSRRGFLDRVRTRAGRR